MEAIEVMSLEDMDPGLCFGQVWKWKSPINDQEYMYFLLHSQWLDDHELAWQSIDLNNGDVKYIYSVGSTTSYIPNSSIRLI